MPFLFPFLGHGWTPPETISEGSGQQQVTLPSSYNIITIIDPPRDINGNVVGTFVDSSTSQTTTSGNTFYFTANSDDFSGDVFVDWNGTDATGTTSHTKANGGNYVQFTVTSTDDAPVLKSGVTNPNNSSSSVSYTVQEGSTFVALAAATDVDGGIPTITISGGVDAAYFTFSSGQLTFNSAPDFEFPQDSDGNNIYLVDLTAADPQLNSSLDQNQSIAITVDDANDAPVITNGNSDLVFTIDEEEDSITWEDAIGSAFNLSVSDVDSTTFSWIISSDPKNGTVTLTESSNNTICSVDYTPNVDFWGESVATSPTAGINGVAEKFTVQVSDGSATDEITFRVKVGPVNDDPPAITSSTSISHLENDNNAITLTAEDPDENPTLTWSFNGGDDVGIFDLTSSGVLTFINSLENDFEGNNSYNSNNVFSFTAKVTDENGQSDSKSFTLTVDDVNEAPLIQQVDPIVVSMFEDNASSFSPLLTASDPDIHSTNIAWNTLSWSVISSPLYGQANVSGSGTSPPVFSYVPNANYNGSDSFSVKVEDSDLNDTISINITVQESDDLPEFSANKYDGNASVLLNKAENITGLLFDVVATDPDGGTVSYSIHHGQDQDKFDINQTSGWVSFTPSFIPDFENPSDGNGLNTYEVTVAAADENGTSYQDFTIQITDEYEPPFFVSSASYTAAENQLIVGKPTVSDVDDGDTHTYSIEPQANYSDDAALFDINTTNGEITFRSAPDFESNGSVAGSNSYNLTIRATDQGTVHADQNITVDVLDDNDQPSLSEGNINGSLISIAEDTIVGTLLADFNVSDQDASHTHLWNLSGTDAAHFEVNPSTGELSLLVSLNYEIPSDANKDNTYDLILTATDSHASPMTSNPFNFQVTVNNVNEPPYLTGSFDVSISVNEDNASSFVSPTWQAIDPETNSSVGITWSLIDNGAKVNQLVTSVTGSTVRIDSVDGILTFLPIKNSNRYVQGSDSFLVSFEDPGGLEDNITVQVSIEAINDVPEVNGTFANTINHPEGTLLVIDYNASDFNDYDTNFFDPHYTADSYLTWQIGGTDPGFFDINNQGALSYKFSPVYDGVNLDNNRYELTVSVSDKFGGISTYPLVINVTNSQEPPELHTTLSTFEISEDENPISWESVWSGVDVQDPDGGTLTWSILTNGIYGVADVEVNTGVIDYVPTPNEFGDDSFVVNVNDGDFDMNFTINVRINQVNDAPQISDLDPTGHNGQELIWSENTPATTVIKTFTADDSEDNKSMDYSSSYFNWSLGGDDADQFQLDINGKLRFIRSMDYETPESLDDDNLYEITIKATDNSVDFSDHNLSVRIANENDPPEFLSLNGLANASLDMNENETAVFTAVAKTKDDNAIGITYSKGAGEDDNLFTINSQTGEVLFVTAPNFEIPDHNNSDGMYHLEVNASDGLSYAIQKVSISILDVNEYPVFVPPSSNIEHNESDGNLEISASDFVSDPDSSPQFSYSIDHSLSNDNQYFSINSATGIITFQSFIPDFENKLDDDQDNIYQLVISVEDNGTIIQGNLNLEITNLNDPPVIEGTDLTQITVNENSDFVKSLVATDQDKQASFADILLVIDDASIGWVKNQEASDPAFSSLNSISNKTGASYGMSADFDRDGDLDAILLQKTEGKITLLENDGTGTFGTTDDFYTNTGSAPSFGIIGDFDEDGYPDLAIAMGGLGEVIIFKNNATNDIGFTEINDISGVSGVSKLDLGDVDSDGDIDVILICENSQTQRDEIRWFKNIGPLWFDNQNSNLSFSPGSSISLDILKINHPKSLSLGDIDQDGDLDLAVASSQDGNFSLLLNDGNGTFRSPTRLYKETNGEGHGVKLIDLNNDSKLDLVFSTKSPSKFGVMLQSIKGGGEFQNPNLFYNSAYFVNAFDFGDFDRDGDLDIIAATMADSNLRCFLNDGNGQFSESSSYVLTGQDSITSISVGDFSQTNSILKFSVKDNYNDWERFVFRPKFSGNLYFKNAPDFENINDVNTDHQFEIKVIATDDENDPNAKTERLVVVNVDNLYEAPVIIEPTAGDALTLSVQEHTTFVTDVNSTNDEANQANEKTFFSISGGVDAQYFIIDEATGILNFISGPDYETPLDDLSDGNNSYNVVVRATDDGPETSYSERVLRIQVLDDNDLPVFNPLVSALSNELNEDSNFTLKLSDLNASDPEGASLTWRTDQNASSGTNQFIDGLTLYYQPKQDFNGTDQIILSVEDNASLVAKISINFVVKPMNDAPIITTTSPVLHTENKLSVTTLTATDVENDVLTWSLIGGLDANRFQLTNSGILSFTGGAPDYEAPDSNSSSTSYDILVSVTDGNASIQQNFTIEVQDVPDIAPFVSNLESTSATTVLVPEGQAFIMDLNFSDVEDNNLTLSLSGGEDQQLFHIAQSGSLSFISNPDYEAPTDSNGDNLYVLDVNITDGVNPIQRSLVVEVVNGNEDPPSIDQDVGSINFPVLHSENESFVSLLKVKDDTNVSVVFSLVGGLDQGEFELNATTGELKFKQEYLPDYEGNGSFDKDNIYHLKIKLSDGLFDSTSDLYIGISDVNEAPVLNQKSFEVFEDQPKDLIVVVFDPEGDPFTWDFLRSPNHGTLTMIDGGYRYTPKENFYGSDEVQFIAIDGQNISYELNASIEVLPQNDDPTALNDEVDFDRSGPATINLAVLDNDSSFPDQGETLQITDWTEKSNSMLSFDQPSQSFNVTPTDDFIGPFSFTYTLYDGERFSKATATINVATTGYTSSGTLILEGWKYISGFGYYMEKKYPWILHGQIGWVYLSESGGENSATWMWNEDLGWFWTGKDYFTHFFAEETQMWYNWEGGIYDPNGVAIFDYSQDLYLTIEEFQKKRMQVVLLSFTGNIQGMIEFISQSDYFSIEQKQQIVSEFFTSGQSSTLENLIR